MMLTAERISMCTFHLLCLSLAKDEQAETTEVPARTCYVNISDVYTHPFIEEFHVM